TLHPPPPGRPSPRTPARAPPPALTPTGLDNSRPGGETPPHRPAPGYPGIARRTPAPNPFAAAPRNTPGPPPARRSPLPAPARGRTRAPARPPPPPPPTYGRRPASPHPPHQFGKLPSCV